MESKARTLLGPLPLVNARWNSRNFDIHSSTAVKAGSTCWRGRSAGGTSVNETYNNKPKNFQDIFLPSKCKVKTFWRRPFLLICDILIFGESISIQQTFYMMKATLKCLRRINFCDIRDLWLFHETLSTNFLFHTNLVRREINSELLLNIHTQVRLRNQS